VEDDLIREACVVRRATSRRPPTARLSRNATATALEDGIEDENGAEVEANWSLISCEPRPCSKPPVRWTGPPNASSGILYGCKWLKISTNARFSLPFLPYQHRRFLALVEVPYESQTDNKLEDF